LIPFLISILILTFGSPALVNLLYRQGWIPQIPSYLYETTWVVTLFTLILFVYLFRSGHRSYFVQLYLLSMVIKLIAYLGYNLIIILQDRKGAFTNVVYFLVVYVLFTAVEIGFLYRKISPRSRS